MVELNTFDVSVINENLDINFKHILIEKTFIKQEFGVNIYKYKLTNELSIFLMEYEESSVFKLSDEGFVIKELTNKGPSNIKTIKSILNHLQRNTNIIISNDVIESNIFLKQDFEVNFSNFIIAIQMMNPLLLM